MLQNVTYVPEGKGAVTKPFSKKITEINLVATCGFKFELAKEPLNLEVVRVGDLSATSVSTLKDAIHKELGNDLLPQNLKFIIPDLPSKGFQDAAIGKLASLINKLYPTSHCNPILIYRSIMDELYRKGQNTFDHCEWQNALSKKSIIRSELEAAIAVHTSLKKIETISTQFELIAKELGLQFRKYQELNRAFNRYLTGRIGSPSSLQLRISECINAAIANVYATAANDSIGIQISLIEGLLQPELSGKMETTTDIKAAIICEIILGGL